MDKYACINCLFSIYFKALSLTGDLYTQAHMMFNVEMYLQLLGILHLAIRNSKNSSDVEREAVSSLMTAIFRGLYHTFNLISAFRY